MAIRNEFSSDKAILNMKAVKSVVISNPGTKYSTIKIKNTLITIENNPSVSTVIGKVSIFSSGFKNVFKTPKTTATIMAVCIPSTEAPGIKWVAISTAVVVAIKLSNSFIRKLYPIFYSVSWVLAQLQISCTQPDSQPS